MNDDVQRRGPLDNQLAGGQVVTTEGEARAVRGRAAAQAKPAKLPSDKKIVHFRSNVATPNAPRRRMSGAARMVWRLAALCIAIPTTCVFLYLALWASPQYVSEVRFAVRGAETSGSAVAGEALSGFLSGIAGGTTNLASDSFILIEFLNSREMVERLEKSVGLRKIYTTSSADFFARMGEGLPVEQVMDYWRKRIYAVYDTSTSIITVQVRAFSAEDALKVAGAVQSEAEQLVNRLSDKAQEDALKVARDELARSETRITTVRELMRRFRDKEQIADPVATATGKQTMLGALEQQLGQVNAALTSRRAFINEQSPTITTLRARAAAIEKEILKIKAELGGDSAGNTVAGTLADFEVLELQRQFAEKAHVATLAMLETARASAERMRRYLATFVEPRMAERATYPKVLQDTFLTFLAATIVFGALLLFYQSIREHMH